MTRRERQRFMPGINLLLCRCNGSWQAQVVHQLSVFWADIGDGLEINHTLGRVGVKVWKSEEKFFGLFRVESRNKVVSCARHTLHLAWWSACYQYCNQFDLQLLVLMLFENVVLQSLGEKDDNTHCTWNVCIPISPIDGFHSVFSLGNWRALHHHAPCWLVNIHITWHLCPPVSMVKDAMESVY